jgi:uncharacterized protein (DUF433 family)
MPLGDICQIDGQNKDMTLKELETQILGLNLTEKAEALQLLTQGWNNGSRRITKTPHVMGGDACIANTRLPVWLFVSLRNQGSTDAELFNDYPQLTAADLVNVWAYAEAYPAEIEAALAEQESAT